MKVWAATMVKDEEDIIYHSILSMAEEGMDGIIIADNLSTDNTVNELLRVRDLLNGSSCEIIIIPDEEPGYYQSQKMTRLAEIAREHGADWVIPFDADELWFSKDGKLGDYIRSNFATSLSQNCATAPLINYFPSALDPPGENPFLTIGWRQPEPQQLGKVILREGIIGQGNHSILIDGKHYNPPVDTNLFICHFPYRSFNQFLRKVQNGSRAYALTDLDKGYGAHWRGYGEILEKYGEEVLRKEIWEKWFWHYSPIDSGLIFDPAPFRRWGKTT